MLTKIMWNKETRTKTAAAIMAGFASNPAIFAVNDMTGWKLVNSTDKDIVGYATHLADLLLGEIETTQVEPDTTRKILETVNQESEHWQKLKQVEAEFPPLKPGTVEEQALELFARAWEIQRKNETI